MVCKKIKLCDLLVVKLFVSDSTYYDILSSFPNCVEVTGEYDYEISCCFVDDISSCYKKLDGNIVVPFRNSSYVVSENNGVVFAYADRQLYSSENLIIREDNCVNLSVISDDNSKILIRLLNELIIRKLLEKNYYPVHASSVVYDNFATLYFGEKGSGKSTALFSSVLLGGACPLANDIVFVGMDNDRWMVFGTSYDLTFDKSLFSQLGKDIPFYNSSYSSDKPRYTPGEFCQSFNTRWVWSRPIESINVVNLSPNCDFRLNPNIGSASAFNYLNMHGKDHNFNFGDILMINGIIPYFDYERLANSVIFNEVSGNIIEHHKKLIRSQ